MRILISACLLGCRCRYDGASKRHPLVQALAARHELVPVCPEQLGGLPTPRVPAERKGDRVVTAAGATDEDVVQKLYDAAAAGVKIDIVLRGNCSLMPAGVDNLHVVGIIDRYLEHSRILIFANGGNPKYYMGSADWMPRNLENRVEVLTPVYDEDLQRDLARTVDYGLRDTTNGRIVDGSGKNELQPGELFRSQEHLYVDYLKEAQEYNNTRS